jgi:non-lysosomal glucosylceramidase
MAYHFNNMRSYALGDESALLMASWPKGHPLYEGMEQEGLKVIQDIRARYDSANCSPFKRSRVRTQLCKGYGKLG